VEHFNYGERIVWMRKLKHSLNWFSITSPYSIGYAAMVTMTTMIKLLLWLHQYIAMARGTRYSVGLPRRLVPLPACRVQIYPELWIPLVRIHLSTIISLYVSLTCAAFTFYMFYTICTECGVLFFYIVLCVCVHVAFHGAINANNIQCQYHRSSNVLNECATLH